MLRPAQWAEGRFLFREWLAEGMKAGSRLGRRGCTILAGEVVGLGCNDWLAYLSGLIAVQHDDRYDHHIPVPVSFTRVARTRVKGRKRACR